MALLLRILLVSHGALALVSCDSAVDQNTSVSPALGFRNDTAALLRGEALFQGTCSGPCHSRSPEAGSSRTNLFDCQWMHGGSDEEIFAIISDGIPETGMAGFGDNFPDGDNDKWKLIAFLRENQPSCD